MANNPELPQEIVVEILSRLPTKSIGKCRCLSKPWHTYLSTSEFIKLHRIRKPNQQNFILVTQSSSLHMVTPSMLNSNQDEFSKQIHPGDKRFTLLLGSCNGLVLMQKDRRMFVMNPITRQHVLIPNPPYVVLGHETNYGFGYDHSSDDYKVVILTSNQLGNNSVVNVYSMKTRVWKTLDDYPFGPNFFPTKITPFVNGALHWLISMNGLSVCVFDLATESFNVIHLHKERSFFHQLVVFQGCLADIILFPYSVEAKVWVMNEHGVTDSWVRFHIYDHENVTRGLVRPMCFVGEEEMLCIVETHWVLYDLKENKWIKKVDGPVPANSFPDLMVFEESLVCIE